MSLQKMPRKFTVDPSAAGEDAGPEQPLRTIAPRMPDVDVPAALGGDLNPDDPTGQPG